MDNQLNTIRSKSNTIAWFRKLLFVIQNRAHMAGACLLIVAVILLFGPIIRSMMLVPSDFQLHNAIATEMAQTGSVSTPHPLYQLLVIGIDLILPGDSWLAALAVTLGFYVFLGLVIYFLMCDRWKPSSARSIVACVFMALIFMIVTPVTLLIPDGHRYLGYIAINVYHNPTIVILRPLAVLLFLCAVQALRPRTKSSSIPAIVGVGILTVVSTLAKPSYIICLLPALFVWTVVAGIRKQRLDWWLMIGGIAIPAAAVLGWQYKLLYSLPNAVEGSTGMLFAPFKVWSNYSSWLFPKFVLSILFPLLVYALYFKRARQCLSLNFAWLVFMIGVAYTYLLAENGKRMMSGNLGWGATMALFILFVFSTLFFVSQGLLVAGSIRFQEKIRNKAVLLCATAFGLHLASGLIWYLSYLLKPGMHRY